jgi:dihydroorotate dehydrogenase
MLGYNSESFPTGFVMMVDVSATIGSVRFSSPLIIGSFDAMVSAGIFSKCFELCGDSLGAIVTKSTTILPRGGYPEPKVGRLKDGLLVASGNTNPGIEVMAAQVREFKKDNAGRVLIGSIVNDPDHPRSDWDDEYAHLATEYAKAGADGVELNLSCPHLDPEEKERTIVPAQDPEVVFRLVRHVKAKLTHAGYGGCLVIPKLTGWNCDPSHVACYAERAGADAVTLSNTFPGTAYHTGISEGEYGHRIAQAIGSCRVAHGKGGYTGSALHPAVLLMIENLRHYLHIPIIGSGGCASDLDALVQTFMAGGTLVQSVTPFYFEEVSHVAVVEKVSGLVNEFTAYLERNNMNFPYELYETRKKAV